MKGGFEARVFGPSSPPSPRAITALLFENASVEKGPFVVLKSYSEDVP